MILSNTEIIRALDEGRLRITPEPAPRDPNVKGCPYSTSSVDLRLGREIAYFRGGLRLEIDLINGSFAEVFGPHSEMVSLADGQSYPLDPGRMVLGRTLETVALPIPADARPSLAARIEGRSSYARCGLLVHFTAPTVHAGFSGSITLELINLGPYPILLRPGAAICQLVIEEVAGEPFRNDSQFHGQSLPGGVS